MTGSIPPLPWINEPGTVNPPMPFNQPEIIIEPPYPLSNWSGYIPTISFPGSPPCPPI